MQGARESRREIRNGVKDTAKTPGVWITPEEGAMANRGRERAGVRMRLSRKLGRDSPGSSFVITTDTPDTSRAV